MGSLWRNYDTFSGGMDFFLSIKVKNEIVSLIFSHTCIDIVCQRANRVKQILP